MGIDHRIINELHERSWGSWLGRRWVEVKEMLEEMSVEERFSFIPPQGESWQQMEARLSNCLSNIIEEAQIKKVECVAVVTHGGALRGLIPILKNALKDSSFKYEFENASVTIFDYVDGEFREIIINDVSHINIL